MNKNILNIEIQKFIDTNLNSDVSELILKGIPFRHIDSKQIIEQIEAKKRCKKKLSTWFNGKNIYYPNKLNIEQSSSETTAKYKANLVSGSSLIDITGGFGIDTYYFSKSVKNVIHCEIDHKLSEIVNHNYDALQVSNVTCFNENGIDALKRLDQNFDWIYIDPSRRNDSKKKVFLLSDCNPNVKTFQGLFLKYAKKIMIKTSPILDIKATLNNLNYVKELHIVAVNNEVKELLWIIDQNSENKVKLTSTNITNKEFQTFEFLHADESQTEAHYGLPLTYLYEPNAAILKAGAFNSVSANFNISKLHKHSHLYTANKLLEFPGRRFTIEKVIPFNKKALAKEQITKANITTRNFPLSVEDIRRKLKIKDGGNTYLFFTTDLNNLKIVLKCTKVL